MSAQLPLASLFSFQLTKYQWNARVQNTGDNKSRHYSNTKTKCIDKDKRVHKFNHNLMYKSIF